MTGRASHVLVDWGNSRLKWATLADGQLGPMQQVAARQPESGLFDTLWAGWPAPDSVICCSVTAAASVELLASWIEKHWQCPLIMARSAASWGVLTNSYQQPEQMGDDRWLAMIGAAERCQGPFAVVDAGTALTVDVVNQDGLHLGGWILPGRVLMHQSLDRNTADVRPDRIESRPGFGQDTGQCVAAGIAAAVSGALNVMCRQLPEGCNIVVCGGDGPWVCEHLKAADLQPDLVLQGLAAWSRGPE